MPSDNNTKKTTEKPSDNKSSDSGLQTSLPSISLPKGGGAIRGIGEKFSVNAVTGTSSLSVPIFTSPGRSGFGPPLSLSYDSGRGNGPFGFGWDLSLPSITRKTDKGLPRYQDKDESDVFILSGAEDLVPVLVSNKGKWQRKYDIRKIDDIEYSIERYRPRIEGLFARIERWTNSKSGEIHWRSISKDNITTLYGKTDESRIYDPENESHIFSWLICESYDDKGNAMRYEYKTENSQHIDLVVSEQNRTDKTRSSNRYLKRIKYGNKTPRKSGEDLSAHNNQDWMFEVVFDYGEHYLEDDKGQPTFVSVVDNDIKHQWQVRQDPFSSFRAGFEIRTYRLCQRVLMFHHFSDELKTPDYLVRSTEFSYDQSPVASFVASVVQSGFVLKADGKTYLKKSLPPLEFEYTKATINKEIKEIDPKSLENLPYGLDGTRYQWVDLDGEGLSGILTEQGGAWFYKRTLSSLPLIGADGKPYTMARFEAQEKVATLPSSHDLNNGTKQQLTDLTGDGQVDLVQFDRFQAGYFRRTTEEQWEPFVPFSSIPNVNWNDPNLKLVDLTGDGHADILITEDQVFTWYPSLAEKGFGEGEKVYQKLDEEKGPKIVFADGTQSIYLADMSGDGLSDLVRIRNGEICYWPNLGYGKFGAKITMDNSPLFDSVDQFDNRRIRLVDADGSGTTDMIYLGSNGTNLYLNQSGNSWKSDGQSLVEFPRTDNLSSVTALDLLGNGTACLLWSSPLPVDAGRSMRYIDLMGGIKPHLLVSIKNNTGSETRLQYAPSTKFYLMDKYAGKPWITKLPFPVHVVERVETYDRISRNLFVTRYLYHDGYFDGIEREFRGFGLVDQLDTAEFTTLGKSEDFPSPDKSNYLYDVTNIEEWSHIPPVLTKTWFHTGFYFGSERISNHYKEDYYREPNISDPEFDAKLLEDTILLDGLTPDEEREACRALKGSILRKEVYSINDLAQGIPLSDISKHLVPYTVSEYNYTIEQPIQRRETINRHAVFLVHPRETIDYHYEKNSSDPRISHTVILKVDDFGNVLRSVAIGYGRSTVDPDIPDSKKEKQTQTSIVCTENIFTKYVDEEDAYRARMQYENSTYELTGFKLTSKRFDFNILDKMITDATPKSYEIIPSGSLEKRLIQQTRTTYRKNDDLRSELEKGKIESLGLPFQSYNLAFTQGLVTQVYENRVTDTMLSGDGKYFQFSGENNWWIPSGKIFYSPNTADTSDEELTWAKAHFFLPYRFQDPFGNETHVDYDEPYLLLPKKIQDAVGNVTTVVTLDEKKKDIVAIDYRVLQPWTVTDPNGNRVVVKFDALGLVAFTAVMGKIQEPDGKQKGDFLPINLDADLSRSEIDAFFDDPNGMAEQLLGTATTRIIYDVDSFHRANGNRTKPAYAVTLARENHVSDNSGPGHIQISFSYSDGFGREVQKKIPAEPEKNSTTPRWVVSGWTIFNNKGKPVKKYEPFFSDTHQFEFAKIVGVSSTLFYDPVERLVATLHPNHTYEKVVFNPWRQETWDVNDTVLQSDPKLDKEVGEFFSRLQDSEYLQTWYDQRKSGQIGQEEQTAAQRVAEHAGTFTVTHFDNLGRAFLTVVDNGNDGRYKTAVDLDVKGNQLAVMDSVGPKVIDANGFAVMDPNGRTVMQYKYDMLDNRIFQSSMDAGKRWVLNDVAGKPIYSWDSFDRIIRTLYEDKLHRPTKIKLTEKDENGHITEKLVGSIIYGETKGAELNHLGKIYQQYDGAGLITNEAYDFKGNLLKASRQLAINYTNTLDWSSPAGMIEDRKFTTSTEFDALNRPARQTHPDNGGIVHFVYNEAGLLEQVEAKLRDSEEFVPIVKDIDYNAKGQRILVKYGNDVTTTYEYEKETFRLKHLQTERQKNEFLQDLSYTYDPVGNITHIEDNADIQEVVICHNTTLKPSSDYKYDPIYQLTYATGREYLGRAGGALQPPEPTSPTDSPRVGLLFPGNCNDFGRYDENNHYDKVGNISSMKHVSEIDSSPCWTRNYFYQEPSLLQSNFKNNRLSYNSIKNETFPYTYDLHGNITSMPHLSIMKWNFHDQLQSTSSQKVDAGKTPETTYYVYDSYGNRVRKITESFSDIGETPRKMKERIYLGGFEIYREYDGTGYVVKLERETLHIVDNTQDVALAETRTQGNDDSPKQTIRYQLGNHLGTTILELDAIAKIITYEEKYSYGSTSYQAGRSIAEVKLKRYRYTGKERDEESGLYYHGARYYAPWLGRWTSCDPIGINGGINLYRGFGDNPINLVDASGTAERPPEAVLGALSKPLPIDLHPVPREAPPTGAQLVQGNSDYLATTNPIELTDASVAVKAGNRIFPTAQQNAMEQTLRGPVLAVSAPLIAVSLGIVAVGGGLYHLGAGLYDAVSGSNEDAAKEFDKAKYAFGTALEVLPVIAASKVAASVEPAAAPVKPAAAPVKPAAAPVKPAAAPEATGYKILPETRKVIGNTKLGERLVKVLPTNKADAYQSKYDNTVGGDVTPEKFLRNANNIEIEKRVGFHPGELEEGVTILIPKEPPITAIPEGYSNVPSLSGHPVGTGVPQFRITKDYAPPIGTRIDLPPGVPYIPKF